MRCTAIIKATAASEAGVLPGERLLAAMGKFNEELVEAGVMLAGEGLEPGASGVRVRFSGDQRDVAAGPFAKTGKLVAGFWRWQVKSMDEAIAWVRRCPHPMVGQSVLEIRPLLEVNDFGGALTSVLREQERRLRAKGRQALMFIS